MEGSKIDVNDPIKGSPQEWTLLHAACWKVNLKAANAIPAKGFTNINNNKNNQSVTPLGAMRLPYAGGYDEKHDGGLRAESKADGGRS